MNKSNIKLERACGPKTCARCLFVLVLLLSAAAACQSVKPYQRQYLNDHEMQAGQKNIARPEQTALTYREGASGGGGGKTGGGCGCN